MESQAIITASLKQDTSPAAVLDVSNAQDFEFSSAGDTASSTISSRRSSMSSFGSNHDHTTPLELGLVINALQTSLTEQQQTDEQEQEAQLKRKPTSATCTAQAELSEQAATVLPSTTFRSKGLKREQTVIVDYELDHGVNAVTAATTPKERSTTGSANVIALDHVDLKSVKPNSLTPREQEKADEPILNAIHHLFSNRFMKAKRIFEEHAETDPLHALGLGSMAFLKALMSNNKHSSDNALKVLMSTYSIATAQIDNSTKRNVGGTVVQFLSSYCNTIKFSRGSGVPTKVAPAKPKALETHKVNTIPNGILRAHIVKAEACLQMAILYLLQESITGYIKCGLNMRRAYSSYSVVWQEYKRMGQLHNEYIDRDTISGIQFGIGAVHLVLSALPQKILRVVAAFGWKADKHLGFALLKLCLENRRARASMSSAMLLAYYTTLTSLCPQILAEEYTQPAIETLLDAQKVYPNSTIFLYFAGKTSRLARNLSLSTQSFVYSIETSKREWAEVEVLHMCNYEIGFNHMMNNNWQEAAAIFQGLFKEKYWSQPIFKYLTGACLDMMGQRTEAILAFAEIPLLMKSNKSSSSSNKNSNTHGIEQYILRKIELFQSSGYQDMSMTLCALEYMYLFNAYEFMQVDQLEQNLALTDYALSKILEAEKLEYGIRTTELLPETPPPAYYDQRAALLLIKASIFNAMGRYHESVIHLNWIMDHKEKITTDNWIVPFAFWEVGITSWNINQKARAQGFWEKALSYTNFDFEYKLAMRVNLALTKASELGIVDGKAEQALSREYEEYEQCETVHQSPCGSEILEAASDYEQEEEDEDNDKKEDDDDKSSTKSLNSDSTAHTVNLPHKIADKIEQVVDQLRLNGSKEPTIAA
ncbi:hypothetical protein [Parasitella parasitica]|uniref:Tetratricopeptide repeat protein 39C n=1 Tax=Parasitella parasitica TaxID=35722 RepID=A0A0B7MYU5_9FUNG|nr:hypothetical protein [Parasitella parasitica]